MDDAEVKDWLAAGQQIGSQREVLANLGGGRAKALQDPDEPLLVHHHEIHD